MKIKKIPDLLLNVVLPVCAGMAVYLFSQPLNLTGFARNQLPDGLWSYALVSCILIIWNRSIQPGWILAALGMAGAFEILQYWQFLNGTGDLVDLATYLAFAGVALMSNLFFQKSMTCKIQTSYAKKWH